LLTGNFNAQTNQVLEGVNPGTIGMLSKKINKLLYYREMCHKPSTEWDPEEVQDKLIKMIGNKQVSSFNHASFEYLMKPELEAIGEPANKFIERKRTLCYSVLKDILAQECSEFTKLYEALEGVMNNELTTVTEKTQQLVDEIITSKQDTFFTADEDYCSHFDITYDAEAGKLDQIAEQMEREGAEKPNVGEANA